MEQLLRERRSVPRKVFLDVLEVSAATFKRDLEYMRERLNAPIIWDRDQNGYRFEEGKATGPRAASFTAWGFDEATGFAGAAGFDDTTAPTKASTNRTSNPP